MRPSGSVPVKLFELRSIELGLVARTYTVSRITSRAFPRGCGYTAPTEALSSETYRHRHIRTHTYSRNVTHTDIHDFTTQGSAAHRRGSEE